MPKINHYPDPLPHQTDGVDTRFEVGWMDQVVTVATTRLLPGVDRRADFVPVEVAAAAAAQMVQDRATSPYVEAWQGDRLVFTDRAQINQMIRSLREARNKAFGRDE